MCFSWVQWTLSIIFLFFVHLFLTFWIYDFYLSFIHSHTYLYICDSLWKANITFFWFVLLFREKTFSIDMHTFFAIYVQGLQHSSLMAHAALGILKSLNFSSVQSLSHVWLFATPWTAACQSSLSITNSQSLLKFMSIESVMPSNHLILCCPLHLLRLNFPSIRVFSDESVLQIRWPILEFQLQHQSFHWIFRTDLFENGLVGSPCSPRDSQESSPTPHFKSINSLMLSFFYGPTLTPIHDYWKNDSFD